jgi:hypothetical protein
MELSNRTMRLDTGKQRWSPIHISVQKSKKEWPTNVVDYWPKLSKILRTWVEPRTFKPAPEPVWELCGRPVPRNGSIGAIRRRAANDYRRIYTAIDPAPITILTMYASSPTTS